MDVFPLRASGDSNTMDWAAIFDVDGTMVDNRLAHQEAWLELGRRRGLPITTEFYRARMHSRSNPEIARLLLGETVTPKASAALSDDKETIYRETYRPHMREIAGLTRLLNDLGQAGVPCGVISNSPPGNVDMVIDGLAIRDRFRVVLDVTQVRRGKPDPELLRTAAAQLGVPVGHCLVMEDSVSGFASAEAAGAPYVVVTAGADPAEVTTARRPAAVVKDFTEMTVPRMAVWAGAGGPV